MRAQHITQGSVRPGAPDQDPALLERRGEPHQAARTAFPAGLLQPPGCFRFSSDALLLGSFLRPAPGARLLDLGTGCGPAALTALLRCPDMWSVGLDIQADLASAARTNAKKLGFASRFAAVVADLQKPLPLRGGVFDLVLANPPWREPGQGRLPANASRQRALFATPGLLLDFCSAAARALAPDGCFGLLYPAARQGDALAALDSAGLTPVRILALRSYPSAPDRVLLIESGKIRYRRVIEWSSLSLHCDQGQKGTYTRQALDFCPFLQKQQ